MTRPWRTLATVPTDEGPLELRQRGDDEFLIVIAGRVLMTSAARRSEEALATLGCAAIARTGAPRVLIGGLGMAYTLRAALDALPATAKVVVAELNPVVADWCRGPMAALTRGAEARRDPVPIARNPRRNRHLFHSRHRSRHRILRFVVTVCRVRVSVAGSGGHVAGA